MNNSKLAMDHFSLQEAEVDKTLYLRQKENELVKIIEAIQGVVQTKAWSSLTNLVFNGVVEKLERDLRNEARKDDPDKLVLARINGQLAWATKYADLNKLCDVFRVELQNIRRNLYGKTQKDPGGNTHDGA